MESVVLAIILSTIITAYFTVGIVMFVVTMSEIGRYELETVPFWRKAVAFFALMFGWPYAFITK